MRFVRQFSMTLVVVTMGAAMALAGDGEVILERSFQVGPGATLAFDSDRGGVAILDEGNRMSEKSWAWAQRLGWPSPLSCSR